MNNSWSPYSRRLVYDFKTLVENLKPKQYFREDVYSAAQKIFAHLSERGCHSSVSHPFLVQRYKVAGSIGKGTSITYTSAKDGQKKSPDLDLVVFLNDAEPPFKKELLSIGQLLKCLDQVSDVSVKKYSIQFKYRLLMHEEIKVDLLCAENFANCSRPLDEQVLGEVTSLVAQKVLDAKQKLSLDLTGNVVQEHNKLLSSALADKTVQVISEHVREEYVLHVVRLAKYWNKRIDMSRFRYVPARSCIMELVAIHSTEDIAERDGNSDSRDLISGFRKFLEKMSDFCKLDISLEGVEQQSGVTRTYSLPMIRDPANAWNNLAEGIPKEAMKKWESQARLTLEVLEEYRNDCNYVENAIAYIFGEKTDTAIQIA